ncbi:uncharacterized protein METZ01_LOCUS149189 [marine metagenome]|uniref:Uncharacterized protein n=1 Tax=marine metagenome TaxID=408172 RepID=A0A382A482_9ZZZZ
MNPHQKLGLTTEKLGVLLPNKYFSSSIQ